MKYKYDLDVDWYQNEKKSVAELGNNVTLKKIMSTHAFKSISPKWLGIFGWNFVWSISRTLMLIGINPSKIHINPGI